MGKARKQARRVRLRKHSGGSPSELTILAATEKLLEQANLTDLSVSAIIDAAGVARPTFYFYFQSRYSVVAILLQRIFDEIFATMQPYFKRDPEADPATTLRSALTKGAEVWLQHSAAIRAGHEHAATEPEVGEVWFGIVEIFRKAIAGEIRAVRARRQQPGGVDADLLAATLCWAGERVLYISDRKIDSNLGNQSDAVEGLLAIGLPAIYGIDYTPPSS
jgi:AcrR family transcriptional regulator